MAGIRFTDEQVSLLRSNPWVKSATPKHVSFTKAFMERFIDLHSKGLGDPRKSLTTSTITTTGGRRPAWGR